MVIAPGPIETFGLAALEAMACGTAVVVDQASALPEVVGPAGVAVSGEGSAYAAGVRGVLARPEVERRAQARRRAEEFGWDRAVTQFLGVHQADAAQPAAVPGSAVDSGPRVRVVALGDSTTVGLGDRMPDGSWRGWAALLAQALAPPDQLEFHNLAELGAQTHTLVERQLAWALRLRPTVATVIVGANDTLRGSFDLHRVARSLETAVRQLQSAGAVVLTARLPDPGRLLSLPACLARPLARRIWAVNEVTDAVARRFSTVHLDATQPDTYEAGMWSADRLHLSERGHRVFAARYADLLAARGFTVLGRPDLEPTGRPPTRWEQIAWLATRGTRWMVDRSTDLVPSLVLLAAKDWWCNLRGIISKLDERVRADVLRCVRHIEAATEVGDDALTAISADAPAS